MDLKEQKQLEKRDYLLHGNMWQVTVSLALPVVFYNLCNYFYGIYDMLLVQSAGIGDAADIIVLDQIKNMISTVGGALATGGGIVIARRFGAKQISQARHGANTLFTLALAVAAVTLLFIPFGEPFLVLFRTDPTTIENAMGYYNVQIITLVITTVNSAMISIQKAKGDTVKLLQMNLVVIAVKLSLTTLFAFGPFENVTATWLAASTLMAQLCMFCMGLRICLRKNDILQVSLRRLNLDRQEVFQIVRLAIPVFMGNFLFSFGKVYVNAVATEHYGKMCVGALGISNTIAGLLPTITNSLADSGGVIVSQNFGNRNLERIKRFLKVDITYVTGICLVGTAVLFWLKEPIAVFFAPKDPVYQQMIVTIFSWECLDVLFLGLSGVSNAVFNGMGKTKVTMSFSMLRLFGLRIPVLLFLMHVVGMDYAACGVAMFVSNVVPGLVEIPAVNIFLRRFRFPNDPPEPPEDSEQE